MKRMPSFLPLLLVAALYITPSQCYALARIQKDRLEEQAGRILVSAFFPSLIRHVNRKHNDTSIKGTVALNTITEPQVEISIQPHPVHRHNYLRIHCDVHNLTGTVVVSPTTPDLEDDNSTKEEEYCDPNAGIPIHIDNLSLAFDFGLLPDNETIQWTPRFLSLHGLSQPQDDPVLVAESIPLSVAEASIQSNTERFLARYIKERNFSVSRIPPIKNPHHGGEIKIGLDVQTFTVTNEYVVLLGGAIFTSHIDYPPWRKGRSITPPTDSSLTIDREWLHNTSLVECSLDVVGLNALVRSIWYLTWSTESPTTEDQAESSLLCEPMGDDPCPFPPMMQSSVNVTAMQYALSAFFLPSGLFKDFTIYMMLPPPSFQFHEDPSSISGSTAAFVYISGTGRWGGRQVRLANITIPVNVRATIPSYNATTGHFYNLTIQEVKLGRPQTHFPRQPYVNSLAAFPFMFCEKPVNAHLQDRALPEANANIARALERLPLMVPPLHNVPRDGLTLHVELSSVHTYTKATQNDEKGGGSGNYLMLDANVELRVTEKEEAVPAAVNS